MGADDTRWVGQVDDVLKPAGWTEQTDRSQAVQSWIQTLRHEFTASAKALDALHRFGGLHVRQHGPGESVAREEFVIDPLLAVGEADRLREFSIALGTELFPIGEAGNGHVFLAIAPDGRVFALMEDAWLLGRTIDEAIESLIRGRRVDIAVRRA